jgi:tellurite resistance protein
VQVSTVEVPRYCRVLRELGDRELRVEVLQVLVDVAAADGVITTRETNILRQITTALGLSQSDYNEAQDKHKDRLAALRPH